ncbi:hypothetical protein BDV95DRAFT_666169 [Massariosphaeria phaeospora]|uniref:Uncharacterized protein n=1 Tax=Massariosphaeria phaeospora TaxID=100035 RepID=A0A7C8IA14_9PLEO|nr:hypothetical protein BDV95DRAFT_666169 [Massariosphaeria phaeospora]
MSTRVAAQSGFHATEEYRLFQIEDAHYIALLLMLVSNPTSLPITRALLGRQRLEIDYPADQIAPVAVIASSRPNELTQSPLNGLVYNWLGLDDVFRNDFLQNVILITHDEKAPSGIQESLRTSRNTEWSQAISPDKIGRDISPGPFVPWKGELCKAFRLYDDPQQAFIVATKPHTAPGSTFDRRMSRLEHSKLGSLITREEPTESADYQAAFNPRGDGYQSAWSSSGRSGAALASYEYLDFTLATDTTGSSRRPALANGVFQIRLSQAALSLDGIVPSWKPFDAPAMFTKDIVALEKWVGAWISAEQEERQSKISIIYPADFLPVSNQAQMDFLNAFEADMESTHGVKKTVLSIKDLWKRKTPPPPPPEADSDDID